MDQLKELWEKANAWISEPGIGQTVVIALLIFLLGGTVIRIAKGAIFQAVKRTAKDEMLARFAATVAHQLLRLVLIIVVLGTVGVDTTSLAALIGGAGVAVGFALRDSLGNFAAGVMLILLRPFNEGDVIEAAGTVGKVKEITIVSTRMATADNKEVVVPNGLLFSGLITNYSRNATRRVDLVAGIGYGDDIDKARGILEDILAGDDLVLADPAPVVAVNQLADSSVNFIVRPWCRTEHYWDVHNGVTEKIKKRFDEAGVSIPFPQRDVHVHQVA